MNDYSMKVLLPSHGILGQQSVNMKIPTFGILHELQSYNQDELLKKFKFVELLTDADFNKITEMDCEYLFLVAAFSLVFNTASYDLQCESCGEKFKKNLVLTEQDIKELHIKKKDLPFHKRVKGIKYTYNLLSAAQVIQAYDWATYEDNTEQAFQDAKVAFIMGKSLNDIQWVRNLPVSVYLAAHLFQKMNYHGLDDVASAKCPKCGKEFKFRFTLTTSVLEFDIDKMMSKFASVSDQLTLSDFMMMSIVDFNAFVNVLNHKNR